MSLPLTINPVLKDLSKVIINFFPIVLQDIKPMSNLGSCYIRHSNNKIGCIGTLYISDSSLFLLHPELSDEEIADGCSEAQNRVLTRYPYVYISSIKHKNLANNFCQCNHGDNLIDLNVDDGVLFQYSTLYDQLTMDIIELDKLVRDYIPDGFYLTMDLNVLNSVMEQGTLPNILRDLRAFKRP